MDTLSENNVDNTTIKEFKNNIINPVRDLIVFKKPLIDRIGGEKTVQLIVDLYFEKMLKDSRVNHFFEGKNISELK